MDVAKHWLKLFHCFLIFWLIFFKKEARNQILLFFYVCCQVLGRILVAMQIIISVLITLSTLTASPDNRSQNACLGNYELHFSESSGNKICTHGGFLRVTLCKFGLVLHIILCCNVIEAVLLFFCFKAIQEQTEKSLHMIGEKSYTRRKRYLDI